MYAECNAPYDASSKAILTKRELTLYIENTLILIDIKEAKVDQKFAIVLINAFKAMRNQVS